MSEVMWMERAQSAEAKLATLEQAYQPALERVQHFKANFGVKESSDGTLTIDFDKLTENLGLGGCTELKAIIEEKYNLGPPPGKSSIPSSPKKKKKKKKKKEVRVRKRLSDIKAAA